MTNLKNMITRISSIGISEDMPYLLQKRIQFANTLSFFLIIIVCFLITGAYILTKDWTLPLTFLSYWVVPGATLFFNYKGKHKVARFILVPLTTLYFTLANTASHLVFQEVNFDAGILNLYMFRHYSPAALMSLLVLLDFKREKLAFIISSSISVFFVATFFLAMQMLGIDFQALPREVLGIGLNEFFLWSSTIIIMGQVIFLISINTKYEHSFLAQNKELASQKEEILQMNDQLNEQKQEITMQRDVLETIHTNLMKSINYAQRIQAALLPRPDLMKEKLPEHFILFRPRDIVSGDFYWVAEHDDTFVLACGDCTGHGVPGAFMTVIGMNLLHQIVMEELEKDPSTILLRLNRRIGIALRHDDDDDGKQVPDGMDIALVVVNKKKQQFAFAGAKRPLYFVPKGGVLEQLRGAKFPIGGGQIQGKYFDTTHFTYSSGDRIYLFSDGYPDQYGGENFQKYMVKKFRNFLISIQDEPLSKQKQLLENELDRWQDGERQTDDILVIGMEFGTNSITDQV